MFIIIILKTVTTYNNHKVRKVDKRFIASIVDHFDFFMEKKILVVLESMINKKKRMKSHFFSTVFPVKYRQLNIRFFIDTHDVRTEIWWSPMKKTVIPINSLQVSIKKK